MKIQGIENVDVVEIRSAEAGEIVYSGGYIFEFTRKEDRPYPIVKPVVGYHFDKTAGGFYRAVKDKTRYIVAPISEYYENVLQAGSCVDMRVYPDAYTIEER
ncbi:MAG: hypothetical protein ACREHG_03080 [Candidatus Saccharimonadales bacterium]